MTSFIPNAGVIQLIRQTATHAGAGWPDQLADRLDAVQDVKAAAPAAPAPSDVADLVHAALTAGDDPADDPDVRRALAAHQLAQLVPSGALERIAAAARLEALTDHADQLYEALADAVADADATIDQARDLLGDVDLTDPRQASNLTDPRQATAAATVTDALHRVEQAVQCWNLLTRQTGGPTVGNNYRPLLVADLTADQLDAVHRAAPKVDHLDVIAAGHRLDLATPDVYRQRVQQVLTQRKAQQQRDDQAWRDQHSLAGHVAR